MVKSMTGFGRQEASDDNYKITAEIKSVNHRYLDFNIKMPRIFNQMESDLRSLVKEYAERGKIDLYITCENFGESRMGLKYNSTMARNYMNYFTQMSSEFGIENDMTVSRLAAMPEVFSMEQEEEDEDTLWKLLESAVRGALEQFSAQRRREGEALRVDLMEKLAGMDEDVAYVEQRSPEIMSEYRKRLEDRLREILDSTQIDEERVLTEATLFADKTCVDEETVRLRSHISGMRKSLESAGGESVGRRLDFLAQEMNREANTILSKCNHMDISETAVRLKTEIEKIREQVQNIE